GLSGVAILGNELREQPLPDHLSVVRTLPRAPCAIDAPALGRRLRAAAAACADRERARQKGDRFRELHFAPPTTSRCVNARSAASQNERHAAYSAGLMRVLRMVTEDFKMTLPPEDSALTEKAPNGVSCCIASGRLFTLRAGGKWMTTSSSSVERTCNRM